MFPGDDVGKGQSQRAFSSVNLTFNRGVFIHWYVAKVGRCVIFLMGTVDVKGQTQSRCHGITRTGDNFSPGSIYRSFTITFPSIKPSAESYIKLLLVIKKWLLFHTGISLSFSLSLFFLSIFVAQLMICTSMLFPINLQRRSCGNHHQYRSATMATQCLHAAFNRHAPHLRLNGRTGGKEGNCLRREQKIGRGVTVDKISRAF